MALCRRSRSDLDCNPTGLARRRNPLTALKPQDQGVGNSAFQTRAWISSCLKPFIETVHGYSIRIAAAVGPVWAY